MTTTTLGYILLGLTAQAPQTGYALRRVFDETPLGRYSSSPGSIYPALKALARDGLLEDAPGAKAGFRPTAAGHAALQAWLREPVTARDIDRSMDVLMARFALMPGITEPAVAHAFLKSFAAAAQAQLDEVRAFLDSEDGLAMPLPNRLAVEFGCRSLETAEQWALDALTRLKRETRKAASRQEQT